MNQKTSWSVIFIVAAILAGSSSVRAQTPRTQQPAGQVFAIPQNGITFLTGDTWQQGAQEMRLYGIQACIRGTRFTNSVGTKQDCGEASLAVFAALVRDTKPTCSPIAQLPTSNIAKMPTVLVICTAHVGENSIDLGLVLITEGYAFAAFTNDAKPVYMPYLVAEAIAKKKKSGLWSFPDLPHPNIVILNALKGRTPPP